MEKDRNLKWQIAVDTGGTFTDCLAVAPDGTERRAKVLSRSALRGQVESVLDDRRFRVAVDWDAPDDFIRGFEFRLLRGEGGECCVRAFRARERVIELSQSPRDGLKAGDGFEVLSGEEAPVLSARLVTETAAGAPLPPMTLRLATTRGTNALLEEKGARVVFFVTEGFGDLLRIGTQQRPDLFARRIDLPAPLPHRVIEVPGRLDARGTELRPQVFDVIESAVREAVASGCTTAAVALMHSFREPAHEEALAAYLAAFGFAHISVSSRLAPMIKLLPRAETTVVDAYLVGIMRRYLDRVLEAVPGGSVFVMSSSGGLTPQGDFRAKDCLLSGPAGGVIGAAAAARRAGAESIIAFDMGGTSTDVSRWAGDYDYQFHHTVGRARLLAPALKIETVAAGGGSICGFDGSKLFVGPESAGAEPGPACYGVGGPLTITDVNLLLGRMDPAVFGLPLSVEAAELAAKEVAEKAGLARDEMLRGFLRIANERMAAAIGRISIREGHDPAESALVAFGGAGGQHACAIAELLGMETIFCPADMGLLSAAGLRGAVVERFAETQVLQPLDAVKSDIVTRFENLGRQAIARLRQWGFPEEAVEVRRQIAQLRLEGQETPLDIEVRMGDIEQLFRERYTGVYGYFPEGKAVEVVALRVVASTRPVEIEREQFAPGRTSKSGLHPRSAMEPGTVVDGPSVIQDRFSTVVVDAGWSALAGSGGTLRLRRTSAPLEEAHTVQGRPVELELFTQRFAAIVEEMGTLLQRTGLSTNIKERLDFSCALLDAEGELIVNAPHIPVHLGAIGLCVRTVAARLEPGRGDMIVTNHPAAGGSHLPDVTVISPVFAGDGTRLGYVANRGHHAEIGGISPGSMPPQGRCLAEEGVVIAPTYLFRGGRADFDAVRKCLMDSPHPTRAMEDNLADLKAQAAANLLGVRALEALASKHGPDRVRQFMAEIKRQAAEAMREVYAEFPPGIYEASEKLDDGTALSVSLAVSADGLKVDFAGTAEAHPGNLNATPAIVRSVLVYVLRLWLERPLPLNEGLLADVTVNLPRCFLNPAFPEDPSLAPAVVGGNVETSQRLVDTFLKALGLIACGQGTMNNLIFGNDRCSYYETIGGGCGAGPDFDGASGVHSHMTNTAITDPEILEFRFPVRLERFSIRTGSGGAGEYRGGDGLVREMTFLEPVTLSLLTQHRVEAPFGIRGGQPGAPGCQWVVRANGEKQKLASIDRAELQLGDRVLIETPGGGGCGR